MIDTALLTSGARELGIDLSPQQIDQFARYAARLIEWNARFNLTTLTDPRDIVIKHFLDSLSAARSILPAARVIDVGAGAGFPGLPIKIARPDVSLTLLEATRKKCEFLEAIHAELKLTNVAVINARAEDAGRDPNHREHYDVAIARAVAELRTLVEYLLPFVKLGGGAIAQKSKEVQGEVQRAQAAISTLGGQLKRFVSIDIAGLGEQRYLVLIEKVAATPEKYPRRAGIPLKRPLI